MVRISPSIPTQSAVKFLVRDVGFVLSSFFSLCGNSKCLCACWSVHIMQISSCILAFICKKKSQWLFFSFVGSRHCVFCLSSPLNCSLEHRKYLCVFIFTSCWHWSGIIVSVMLHVWIGKMSLILKKSKRFWVSFLCLTLILSLFMDRVWEIIFHWGDWWMMSVHLKQLDILWLNQLFEVCFVAHGSHILWRSLGQRW